MRSGTIFAFLLLCSSTFAQLPPDSLALWLRADVGVVTSGSQVTQWLDQSGNGRHATASGNVQKVESLINGFPAVQLFCTNGLLMTPAFQTFPGKRGAIFVVARTIGNSCVSGAGYGAFVQTYYGSGTTWQFGAFPSYYGYYDGVGSSNFNVATLPVNAWGIVAMNRTSNTTMDCYKSGIFSNTVSIANNQPSLNPVRIGASSTGWEVLNGYIAEVIIYNKAMSPAELEQVNTYLADKYYFNGDVPLPTAQGVTVCGSGTATLTATGGNAYRWYDSQVATVPLATTASFTTPMLASTTTYYVANFNGQLQSQRVPVTVTVQLVGDACDDGDPNTTNDLLQIGCVCAGTPVSTCTTDLVLEFRTDANGAQNTWEILQQGTGDLVISGGGTYPNNVTYADQACLPNGCYYLRVLDSGGDGIVGGGYILRTLNGVQRIIDNRNNFTSGSVSAVVGNGGFCLPLGTDRLIFTSCDKLDWVNNQFIVAAPNPAVSAQFGVNNANSGYQFWFFDPNGTYGYAKFRSHATSDGFGTGATRACHARINNWSPNQIPANVLMNVKVRGRVNGTNLTWGPVCRFMIDPVRAVCPLTKLVDIPGNTNYSCGVTRNWGGSSSSKVVTKAVDGATQYQFRWWSAELASPVVRTTTTPVLQLNWDPALANGTYEVEVRAFKNGQWCVSGAGKGAWGDLCNVTINGSTAMALNGSTADGTPVSASEAKLFPNPNNGQQLTVSLSAVEAGVETVAVDIFDLNGAHVSAQVIAVNDGMVFHMVDVNRLADGLYMVNITAGGQRYTERLVISK
jgi:hypothetical protein